MNEVWKKNCPKCGGEQVYCSERVLETSLLKNALCNICRSKLKRTNQTEKLEKNCPKCGTEQKYTNRKVFNRSIKENWLCKKCATKKSAKFVNRFFMRTDEYRKKQSDSHIGKITSESTKEKLRIAKIKQIKKLGTQTNYNIDACKYIDDLNKENLWNLRHALNGGEIKVSGYSLDGYDKEKNIVFEYDEPKHEIKSIKERDKIREQKIIQKINPKMFIRYNEKNDELYDVISGRRIS